MLAKSWVSDNLFMHPYDAKGCYAMLLAYMDESGSHDEAMQSLFAGYWAPKGKWAAFERDWRWVLKKFEVSEFHAKKFWQRHKTGWLSYERVGEYKGWNDKRALQFVHLLLAAICGHKLTPFACGVDTAEWKNQPDLYKKVFSGFAANVSAKPTKLKPLYLPFQMCVVRAASYCHPGVRMNFYLDQNPQTSARITQCFMELKKDAGEFHDPLLSKIGELHFADSKDSAPIQAADLLAYELYHYGKQRAKGRQQPRKEMMIAMSGIKTIEDFWLFDAVRFENLKKALEANVDRVLKARAAGSLA